MLDTHFDLTALTAEGQINYVNSRGAVLFTIYTSESRRDLQTYLTKKAAENRAARDAAWVSSFDQEHDGRGHTNYLTVEKRFSREKHRTVYVVVWVISPYTVPQAPSIEGCPARALARCTGSSVVTDRYGDVVHEYTRTDGVEHCSLCSVN